MNNLNLISKKTYVIKEESNLELLEHIICMDQDKLQYTFLKLKNNINKKISHLKLEITFYDAPNNPVQKALYTFNDISHIKNYILLNEGIGVHRKYETISIQVMSYDSEVFETQNEIDLTKESLHQVSMFHKNKNISFYITLMFFILFLAGIIISYFLFIA
ncbi:hypothetical protein BN85408360 [Alteracholeplasma palmae J233]|uniref:Uncharacterized protein n=1 Tax=Alteracholeplasma palmae (strain ATCC 49389 / J233) TaxID=1318466 RepID=U4KL23_ALTPJ|nr:hypothetical protein [Alteracholeplasma palmae]CCV64413.1 hypothetical protein BN85408360 [Alteracholeplasma palmae J233]